MDCIISRQDPTEERISEMENKIEELLHANNHYKNIIYMNTIHKNSGT
jgi:hypothetical protein